MAAAGISLPIYAGACGSSEAGDHLQDQWRRVVLGRRDNGLGPWAHDHPMEFMVTVC